MLLLYDDGPGAAGGWGGIMSFLYTRRYVAFTSDRTIKK